MLLAAFVLAALPLWAQASPASIARGRRLAEMHCNSCHAIAGRGPSPTPGAPPFATLQDRSPGRTIEAIFADGLMSGHPPMPSFLGRSDQMQDLLDYVRSVQPAPAKP